MWEGKPKFLIIGDCHLLIGVKIRMSNSSFEDIAVVWAKNDEGSIQGLIVEQGVERFSKAETHSEWSLQTSATDELIFDNVKIMKENISPHKSGLGVPLGCLDLTRVGIAWGTIGAAMDCYDTALRYAKE